MSTFTPPKSMSRLVTAAMAHRRPHLVHHDTDTGGNPFVTVRVRWAGIDGYQAHEVNATWHTRATGTYRLTRVTGSWARRDHTTISLAKAVAFVAGEWVPQEVQDLLDHGPPPEMVDVHLPA